MTLRPEQQKAMEYLHDKGTQLAAAVIHERVAAAFAATENALASVSAAEAGARPFDGEWTIQEVVDHLVGTHRPSLDELRELLDNRRPAGGPIPASLQSADPMGRGFDDLVHDLATIHSEILQVLSKAPERMTDARAPVVMVINVKEDDGELRPLHWIEELDWKAYAVIFRLHELDHLNQIKKTLRAARAHSR
jgi:DinB family protein